MTNNVQLGTEVCIRALRCKTLRTQQQRNLDSGAAYSA